MTLNCMGVWFFHLEKLPWRQEGHPANKNLASSPILGNKIRNRLTRSYERKSGALSVSALRLEWTLTVDDYDDVRVGRIVIDRCVCVYRNL